MSERREAHRRRVYLGARIVHPHLRSDTACLLRDLSGLGARIAVCATVPLPDRFDLVVDSRATTRPVEAVWRTGDALGVRFLAALPEDRDLGVSRIGPPSRAGEASPDPRRADTGSRVRPSGELLH